MQFHAGARAWAANDLRQARVLFEQALRVDPLNADALLGLQYMTPSDVDLCARLYEARAGVGRHQRRPTLGVHGRCFPLGHHPVEVVDSAGVALAYASALAETGQRQQARGLLADHAGELPPHLLVGLHARIAFDDGDFSHAVKLSASLSGAADLGVDGALLHGAAVLHAGDPVGCRAHLMGVELATTDPTVSRRARDLLAQSYQRTGDDSAAARLLDALADEDTSFTDTVAAPAAHTSVDEPAGDLFELLRQSFESGVTADSPDIADNQPSA